MNKEAMKMLMALALTVLFAVLAGHALALSAALDAGLAAWKQAVVCVGLAAVAMIAANPLSQFMR